MQNTRTNIKHHKSMRVLILDYIFLESCPLEIVVLPIGHCPLNIKVSKGAKFRNQYNQVPHLTQDTNGKVTNSQLDTTNESQEVSPFPAGDHKAHKSNMSNMIIFPGIMLYHWYQIFQEWRDLKGLSFTVITIDYLNPTRTKLLFVLGQQLLVKI